MHRVEIDGKPAARGRCQDVGISGLSCTSMSICLAWLKSILWKACVAEWALLTRADKAVVLMSSAKNSMETLNEAEKPQASSSLVYAASEEDNEKASASTLQPGGKVMRP